MRQVLLSSLALLLAAAAAPAVHGQKVDPDKVLEPHVFRDGQGRTMPYRLLKPETVEEGKTYPLVLFLHGAGERGSDNVKQMVHGVSEFVRPENRRDYPCFLLVPQCPEGKRWVEVDWGADSHVLPKEPSEPLRLVLDLLDDALNRYPIDRRRVYVTGLSMGGFGVWDLLARRPDLFAAAVPVCGGGDPATAKAIKDVPVWVFHGARDGAVKPKRSRDMVKALEDAGGKPKYTEYPDVGHDSWNPAYRDPELMKWLFDRKKPG
jgi:predicted peptidase